MLLQMHVNPHYVLSFCSFRSSVKQLPYKLIPVKFVAFPLGRQKVEQAIPMKK